MQEILVQRTEHPKAKPTDETALGFGRIFSDHMFLMDYDEGKGWNSPRIVPYGPISMDPACSCLHYAQEIFEGMKAYRTAEGKIQFFRPEENFSRLNRSCERMAIPKLDEALLMEALRQLVTLDRDWVPSTDGAALYLRPFVIGDQNFLGVHPSNHYTYCVILSPSGAYYASGLNPVKIYVEKNFVRAAKGGTGGAKTGANYAASLIAQEEAEKQGYAQVLWLDGSERTYVEEVGSMNVFFRLGDEVVTPMLTGSILPGITRKSVIEMLQSWGINVSERLLSIDELMQAAAKGQLLEAWGTGTAAVISPIGELKCGDQHVIINQNRIGDLSQKLYDTLTGIQWGRLPDSFGWITPCC